ncbi:MAG: 2-(1,2-epoxy,2-dihydrophenyl)acetyl-CoA isomerase [Solirubrobacteraceae bacterium]|jgi:enoyl-CoA hydratase/carnithine racemase|nr:2-(1,2-epoxy,2-dihydrophenyl)acetyl-CoA isomerase [Solirubrobacteraceae bacterium]
MTDLVLTEDHGHVRHLILNRPDKRNAFNQELIAALHEALVATSADPNVFVIVLRGNGVVFSAGVDLMGLGSHMAEGGIATLRPFRRAWMDTVNLLEEMPKVSIASIHGGCFGGALETALACDMRIMTTDTKTGLPETKLGLLPDVGGSSRLPQVVGLGRAKELILTSRIIDGVEAERIGLANRAVEPDALEAATQELVDELLGCSPVAMGLAKRVMDASARPTLSTSLEMEISLNHTCMASDDFKAGVQAFMEKRPAEFTGQ